jgi:RND family efflux transporter MFP subunit
MAFQAHRTSVGRALLAVALAASAGDVLAASATAPQPFATAPVTSSGAADTIGLDGVVQAVRQTTVAAQVAGSVVSVEVKAGDTVKAGQVLLRLDARAAEQTAAAGAAQVRAARAALEVAAKDFERQEQLFQKDYISQAALDRAEAQYKAAQAEASAQLASAGVSRTQSGFYVLRAPYDGIVSSVAVVLGDMAMPDRPLLSVYDPRRLRVSVAVPQSVAARMKPGLAMQVELPGAVDGRIAPAKAQLLPTADATTHTLELRLDLPAGLAAAVPGMFARAWLGMPADATRLYVPAATVVRRAELTAVYVMGPDGRPMLRQVRLGRAQGGVQEVLAGVSAGERVVLDPQLAVRLY